tara:strand:- start:301 stop:444 length:144 start_codon:yes stop_codon:yes gene_type:complete
VEKKPILKKSHLIRFDLSGSKLNVIRTEKYIIKMSIDISIRTLRNLG